VILFVARPAPRADDPPDAGASVDPPPSAQLESLTEPDDLAEAEDVAAEFARALLAGDLDALDDLTTPAYRDKVIGSQARSETVETDDRVAVEAIIPRDLHLDHVTLQVIVRITEQSADRIEAVTLSLVRAGGQWRVADGAI
jgi:hypothetical protein